MGDVWIDSNAGSLVSLMWLLPSQNKRAKRPQDYLQILMIES